MGASEILQVLEKGDKLTTAEIARRGHISECAVKHGIKRLLKDISENINMRILTPEEKEERYGKKVCCRVHLYWMEN